MKCPVILLNQMGRGHELLGPAVIIDGLSTLLVEPGCKAVITERGDVRIDVGSRSGASEIGEDLDPVQLSIFAHRFMSIAEQMGRLVLHTFQQLFSNGVAKVYNKEEKSCQKQEIL
jgi:5-oxoprolinase (ATP-hydrolysing)